ncbi:ATP-binding protein [Alteribacillus bidgolensis]|uniref:Circadian input-output histidine kinase CikA n=1 Tax=Alteribacillus bidgolensis TaxID=930129 RepID=A0A1G8CHT0_9BACI|nr:ATP-binding protein [Alteribacillus bidgolensis]SDH44962.1 Signal transduction histidine kinase [Alteribacillus bidgolensis]
MLMKWFPFIVVIVLCSLWPGELEAAAAVDLKQSEQKYDLHSSLELLQDKEGIWSVEEVSSEAFSASFTKNKGSIPSFGYTSSVYWIRFQLENNTTVDDWVLEIAYPPHDSIELYEMVNNRPLKASETGDLKDFYNRDKNHRHFTFNLNPPENEPLTYYLRFESEGSMQVPLTLWSEEAFAKKSQIEYLILGLYYGICIVMILYNLFLFFSLRLHSYLWYVLFILALTFTHLTLNGAAYQFLWPESPWWNNRAIVFFMAASNAMAFLFTKSFLNTPVYTPKLNQMFKLFVPFQFFIMALLMISYNAALNLVMLCTIVLVFIVLTAAGFIWRKGYSPARYFFFGWIIFLVGVFLSSVADAGFIPITFFTKYASQIGSAFEVILFSLALADKFNVLRMEKEKAERHAKESQELAVEQLKKTNRLKDEFLANTSHELRTPLNGIIGIAESLRDGAAGQVNISLKNNLNIIIQSGKRLSHLVNDLLDFSKLKHKAIELQWKPVRLKEATDVVFSLLEPLMKGKPITFNYNITTDLPLVKADENRVQQILHNIIGNAVKFTETGSITVTAEKEKDSVLITVQDTGIGIKGEDLNIIFNEFEQGSDENVRRKRGTGLGLSITKKLIELHGGTISVMSEPKKGTTVRFSLPLYDGAVNNAAFPLAYYENYKEEAEVMDDSRHLLTKKRNKGSILIADDEPINLQVLQNHLRMEGYDVTAVTNGEQVLQKAKTHVFDLIIIDVMMPVLSGYKVSELLRKNYSLTELPILIVTARNELEDIVTAFRFGANDYLSKPCYKEELLARVQTLLTMQKAMKDTLTQKEALNQANNELKLLNHELEERVKERTKKLELKTEELLRMEKSRRHLLSNISHDLGTPMTSLQGYIKAMIDEVISVDNKYYLEMVYEKVLFIDRLIRDLYDLSRLEARQVSFHWEYINASTFINQFLPSFESDVRSENLSFVTQNLFTATKDGEAIYADLDRLKQVMTNLIYNAVKYTSDKGTIVIEVNDSSMPSRHFRDHGKGKEETAFTLEEPIEDQRHSRCLVIGVHDTGRGIDPESLPFIFDRFFREDSSRPSSDGNIGLGLNICKEIVEYHGGTIWAESKKQKGSTFYFTLPLYPLIKERS